MSSTISLSASAYCFLGGISVGNPLPASTLKPPTFFSPPPGQLFLPKTEAASATASVTNDTWKFITSLTLDNQPKATPVSLLTSQASASTSASTAPAGSTAQDYPTVNLADLHGLTFGSFPAAQDPGFVNAATRSNRVPGSSAVGSQSHQASIAQEQAQAFAGVTGPQFLDEDLPEFPSFNSNASGTLESLSLEDFQTLLAQSGLQGETSAAAATGVGASASVCQLPSAQPCSSAATNIAHPVENSSANHTGSDGTSTTLMNYPASLASLLHGDCSVGSPSVHQISMCLDDSDMNSLDDDRLMSILNCGPQAGFLSGHPS